LIATTIHAPVARPEDLPHSAAAQLVEHDIVTEHERFASPGAKIHGLVLR
jgi:hypothetical protein